MTEADTSLPPATTRRELRERERAAAARLMVAAADASGFAASTAVAPVEAAPVVAAMPAASAVPVVDAASATDTSRAAEPRMAPVAPPVSSEAAARIEAPRSARGSLRRRIGRRLLSAGALLFAGAFIVGVSLPANALDVFTISASTDTSLLAASVELPGQSIEVDDAVIALTQRDDFEVKSWAQILQEKYGNRGSYQYSVGTGGAVRWPFPYFVPISSGYGPRVAPCRGCSTDHNAIDLTPGAGAPIYAIADGVVIRREPRGGSWGNNLTLEHQINGQTVTSSYAHMQWDSSPIELGQTIKVGDFLGLVGATGQATGAHLHLEIKVDGVYVDPYVWLKANAG